MATETKTSDEVEKYTLDYTQPNQTRVTDSLGYQTTYEWADIWGARRIVKVTGPCPSCGGSGGDVQQWTYDNRGRVASYTDGGGNVTKYTYDAEGNVMSVAAPAPAAGAAAPTTTYTYYADGRMHTRQSPNGGLTTWTYVAAGPELITETVSQGVTRTTRIDYTQGKPTLLTDPLGRTTTLHYSALGDLDWTEDAVAGHRTTFAYDAMGRLEKTSLPATTPPNDSPSTSYDTVGRVWRVRNPNGSDRRPLVRRGGRRLRTQDPNTKLTQFQYDGYGRLSKVFDPLNGETGYGYDLMSNLVSLTDARHKQTSFTYDGYRRVTKIIYPNPSKAGALRGVHVRPGGTAGHAEGPQGRHDHVCL